MYTDFAWLDSTETLVLWDIGSGKQLHSIKSEGHTVTASCAITWSHPIFGLGMHVESTSGFVVGYADGTVKLFQCRRKVCHIRLVPAS